MTPEPVLFVLDHRGMGDVIILFFSDLRNIFIRSVLQYFSACIAEEEDEGL